MEMMNNLDKSVADIYKTFEEAGKEIMELKQEKRQLEYRISELKNCIADLDRNYQEASKENMELKQERRQLEDRISELKERLSRYTGTDLMAGNRTIPYLSDIHRPTKLAETYNELFDNDWSNAYEELDVNTNWKEPETIKYLLEVLQVAYECCNEAAEKQLKELKLNCYTPTLNFVKKKRENYEQVKLDALSQQAFVDLRKKTWCIAAADIFKHFEEITKKDKKWDEAYHSHLFKMYIKSCIDLCWRLVIQSPPLYIGFGVGTTNIFEPGKYKVYTKKGKKIDFVVWPPLYLHREGPMLCKGVAQGKK